MTGAKSKTKRKGADEGEKRGGTKTGAEDCLGGGEVETRCQKRESFCIWVAGRRIRWRVLGVIIKTPDIGPFVCDSEKLTFNTNGKMETEVGRTGEGVGGRRVEGEGGQGAHATRKGGEGRKGKDWTVCV